ncbi:MAG: hypothetical protein PHV68_06965 [Candidatus Gastranaerophilales bacterium]|nr:hypothetical protein [Candidatus Gastranaerophilales bacterium]
MKINNFKKYFLNIFLLVLICSTVSSCDKISNKFGLNKAAQKPELVTIDIDEEIEEEPDETVLISIENFGRNNPFKPYYEKSIVLEDELTKQLLPSIPPPPMDRAEDEGMGELLSIQIAGILYDSVRPLAILKIAGQDYLVHQGDKIFDYYVQDISSTKVAVQRGANIYRAGVGEIVEGNIENNTVYDLGKMFAGYKKYKQEEKLRGEIEENAIPLENILSQSLEN